MSAVRVDASHSRLTGPARVTICTPGQGRKPSRQVPVYIMEDNLSGKETSFHLSAQQDIPVLDHLAVVPE